MHKIFFIVCLVVAVACSNSTTESTTLEEGALEGSVHAGAADTIITNAQPFVLDGCYEMTMKKDSAFMQLQLTDSVVTGTLNFNFFEKDNNKGTVKGVLRGDKIIADYTFQSEGLTTVLEVIFQLQDKTLVQGFGDLQEKGGKLVFADPDNLQYQSGNPFIKTDCLQD